MELGKFGHGFAGENPGSEWIKTPQDQILFPEHSSTVADLLSDEHYDVFVRYGYARSLVSGSMDEEHDFWKNTYENMQNRRVGRTKTREFDDLIRSFEKEGFREGEPIPVDEKYELLDGSHRLACAALFEENPRVAIYNKASHSYNKEWFEKNKFSGEEIGEIDKTREFLLNKYQKEITGNDQVAIIWGAALEYWDEILGNIDSQSIRRAFVRDYGNEIETFIKTSYANDGMPMPRIIDKAKRLSEISSKTGIIVLDENAEGVVTFKKRVREEIRPKMENYFFDCIIHTIDDPDQAKLFFKEYDIKNI